jgi:hypothetical protein
MARFGIELEGSDPGNHPASHVADLSASQLAALLDDEAFISDVTHHTAAVSELADAIPTAPEVAYFSPEFGITDVVPQYSGGLGILAGDHWRRGATHVRAWTPLVTAPMSLPLGTPAKSSRLTAPWSLDTPFALPAIWRQNAAMLNAAGSSPSS